MTIEEKFWAGVKKEPNGCWLWVTGKSDTGYGEMHQGAGLPKISTHRFSWELHFGRIPEGMCVLHKCDVRACVRPDHLFLGTRRDNSHDARSKGRLEPQRQTFKRLWREKWSGVRCGENIHCSKLTAEKVRIIRKLHSGKQHTLKQISEMFGISSSTVLDTVRMRTWKHIKDLG